jgi:hypothetical protein
MEFKPIKSWKTKKPPPQFREGGDLQVIPAIFY